MFSDGAKKENEGRCGRRAVKWGAFLRSHYDPSSFISMSTSLTMNFLKGKTRAPSAGLSRLDASFRAGLQEKKRGIWR
jgi:hypothetical protein